MLAERFYRNPTDRKLIAVMVLAKRKSAGRKFYRALEENLAGIRGVARVERRFSDTPGEPWHSSRQKEINRSYRSAVLLHGGKEAAQEAAA